MNCPNCSPEGFKRGIVFAFLNGQIVYACTKCAHKTPKDPITDWFRVGNWKRSAT